MILFRDTTELKMIQKSYFIMYKIITLTNMMKDLLK